MADYTEWSRHFEAILGYELEAPDQGGVVLREPVAVYATVQGHVTSREIGATDASTRGCDTCNLLDISGTARMGEDGTTTFGLGQFVCGGRRWSFKHPVVVVATARGERPVFVTAQARPSGSDVIVEMAAWAPGGSSAPNARVSWHCRAPYEIIVE